MNYINKIWYQKTIELRIDIEEKQKVGTKQSKMKVNRLKKKVKKRFQFTYLNFYQINLGNFNKNFF